MKGVLRIGLVWALMGVQPRIVLEAREEGVGKILQMRYISG